MPQSDVFNIPFVIRILSQINPHSILDVGIGNGSYGMLCRQYLDIAYGRLSKESWGITIDGIEIFPNYQNPIWAYFYDRVHVGNALEAAGFLGHHDATLIIDVIEHFAKADGLALINKLITLSDFIIITTPIGEYQQGEKYGNTYETHLSEWGNDDFRDFPHLEMKIDTCNTYILTSDQSLLDMLNLFRIPRLIYPGKSLSQIGKNIFREIYQELKLRFGLK